MPVSDATSIPTNMTTLPPLKKLAYTVTADYLPFRRWQVDAYSAMEACMDVHALTEIPINQLEAAK
jgi:hypothetical protein